MLWFWLCHGANAVETGARVPVSSPCCVIATDVAAEWCKESIFGALHAFLACIAESDCHSF